MKKNGLICVMAFFCMVSLATAKTFEIYTGEWAPYVSEKMENGGPTAVIISEAMKAADHDVTFKFVPWKRAEVLTQKGKAVGTFPWSPMEAFNTCYNSSPIASNDIVFFYIKDKLKDWDFTELEALKKFKIGGSSGYSYTDTFKNAGIKIDLAPNIELSLKKLIAGRIDMVPENILVGKESIQKAVPESADAIGIAKTPLYSKPLHFMISKDHPDGKALYDAFEKGLSIIKENGTYDKIVQKYGL